MKQIYRITEEDLKKIIRESIDRILAEDGVGGGGATNAAGTMQGGGTNPGAGTYDVPAFAGKSKKKVGGNAFSEPIMRQKHNLGDVTSAKANQVDMKPALDRTPGFSMGERVGKKKVSEAVDESIGNWLKTTALGGMMAMSPMQGNAQSQTNDSLRQDRNSVEALTKQYNKTYTVKELMQMFPQAYEDRNASPEVWIQNARKGKYHFNSNDENGSRGRSNLVAYIAGKNGQNPWNALLKRYCPNSDEHIFQLGDFDIQ
jgi:hypothetical protein